MLKVCDKIFNGCLNNLQYILRLTIKNIEWLLRSLLNKILDAPSIHTEDKYLSNWKAFPTLFNYKVLPYT